MHGSSSPPSINGGPAEEHSLKSVHLHAVHWCGHPSPEADPQVKQAPVCVRVRPGPCQARAPLSGAAALLLPPVPGACLQVKRYEAERVGNESTYW